MHLIFHTTFPLFFLNNLYNFTKIQETFEIFLCKVQSQPHSLLYLRNTLTIKLDSFYFPSVFFSVFWSHIDTHCEGKLWIHLLELLAEMLLCGCLLVFHDQRGLDLRGHLHSHQLLHDGQGKLEAGARASACNDVAIFLNAGL